MMRFPVAMVLTLGMWGIGWAQSNSLFKHGKLAGPGEDTIRTTALARVTTSSDRDFKKHDLITIIINERTRTKIIADSEAEKKTSLKAVVDSWPRFTTGGKVVDVSPTKAEVVKLKAERDFTGGGSKRRDDLFLERITAEIVDVKPNGTLVIEAKKQRTWMGEVQILTITGVVRKEDVREDNTVLSEHIANLTLSYETRGQVSSSARRGLLDWLLDLINIF